MWKQENAEFRKALLAETKLRAATEKKTEEGHWDEMEKQWEKREMKLKAEEDAKQTLLQSVLEERQRQLAHKEVVRKQGIEEKRLERQKNEDDALQHQLEDKEKAECEKERRSIYIKNLREQEQYHKERKAKMEEKQLAELRAAAAAEDLFKEALAAEKQKQENLITSAKQRREEHLQVIQEQLKASKGAAVVAPWDR
eukprot:GHVT01005285.1.p1 GENE.GHVT01005285.1~~GHVT01005285.1.p1  ORF type:complete len:198 (-),score=58.81 GHVT01005285.1:488-1081(-)